MKSSYFINLYSQFLKKFLKPARPLKIVFDYSNGTAEMVLKKLKINNSKEKQADLGVIFDGDGDRALFVDDKGRSVDPDAVARLLIWYLRPRKIVISAVVGQLVRKFRVFETPVGHIFIAKKMMAEKADLGIEHSGHYYFKKFFYLDSGILAAIEVINAVSRLPYKFSDFVDLLPASYRREINFPTEKIKSLEKIENYFNLKPNTYNLKPKINRLDGLKIEFPDWWFNLRPSQTEPLWRLDIEAQDKNKLQAEILNLEKILL